MNELKIVEVNGKFVTDSREVAERTGKQHSHLLRDIQGYISILGKSNFGLADFFVESNYIDAQGKDRICFLLTRKGCDMIANKMTGEKGILFTAEYVTEFEKMEQIQKTPNKMSPMEILETQFAALKEQDNKINKVDAKIDSLEANMPLFNNDCKELQSLVRKTGIKALGGYKSLAYNDNSLRGRVYADIQHEIKREFGVNRYEAIKRSQLERATYLVTYYELPLVLQDEVLLINNQLKFTKAI